MNIFYYRDRDGNEIDLLIKRGDELFPVEIKKHINCDRGDIGAFGHLDKIPGMKRREGCVICMADDVFPVTAGNKVIGVRYL